MQATQREIAAALIIYYQLPPTFETYFQREINWYDPRIQISRSRPYRRVAKRSQTAPYYYNILLLYILEFGQVRNKLREQLENHDQIWLLSGKDFMPTFALDPVRQVQDQPQSPRGAIIDNQPLPKRRKPPQIIADLTYWDAHGHWPTKPDPSARRDGVTLTLSAPLTVVEF
ncbi:hypothetical protein F4819DRAFT_473302 [Hypoxylon fuscum]|nr:hypothetical protein F4819DRAFT_473302 [Hypoxylon fuscum]